METAAMVAGYRDLSIEDSATRGAPKTEAAAMGGGLNLLAMKSTAEAQPVSAWKKKSEAIRPWEVEGEILRLKKEADAAWDLWFLTQAKRKNAQRRMTRQERAEARWAGKKRKVVKTKLREDYVDHMAANPFIICADLPEEKLAQRSADFRQIYAAAKFLEAKHGEYWKALIAQKAVLGYAEDENEVTDDDDDEVVVKN